MMQMHLEREKKFLIHATGKHRIFKKAQFQATIIQGYLAREEEREVRIRYVTNQIAGHTTAYLQIKTGKGEHRFESLLSLTLKLRC